FSEENKKPIKGVESKAMGNLMHYPWPGNARELRNVIERAVVLCQGDYITAADFPEKLKREESALVGQGETSSLKHSLSEYEKNLLLNMYHSQSNSKEETAKALGIDLATLYRKLKKYGIEE
ncbi:MAG TPA: helix-turn-helix domain-containing protein, partial [Thermodesulfovibrionales bacterium]|nr:helix-turn-helix domain-containing protein [Thermodesulfovibrionales bacterium]